MHLETVEKRMGIKRQKDKPVKNACQAIKCVDYTQCVMPTEINST